MRLQRQLDGSIEIEDAASSRYERFRIETKPAENRFNVPSKFNVRARRFRLAAMLVHEAFHYRFNREVVLSRPCIYGVFSGRFGGFKPIKKRCVGCMRCVQEYPHIMRVDYSKEYQGLGDSHWTPDSIFTVLYESSTGKIPVKGMGFKGRFGGEGWDGIWTDMSEIVRPTRDGVFGREYISTIIDVGSKPSFLEFPIANLQTVRLLQSPLPIAFAPPAGCTDKTTETAVAEVASRLGIYYFADHKFQGGEQGSWVPVLSSEEQRKALDLGRTSMIEVDFSVPEALAIKEEIRHDSPSTLISARLALDDNTDQKACRLVRDGVDVLHLFADYHGFDYSSSPRHISDALGQVHTRLVEEGLRDNTTIIGSGGITLAEHVPKAIICGADLVALDTTLLVALQSEFKGETRDRSNCRLTPKIIDSSWGTQRLTNLMASWHDQLIEVLSAMGMRDVRRLRGDTGRSIRDSDMREQAFEGIHRGQQ